MIQDIAPHHLFNEYQPNQTAKPKDTVMVAQDSQLLVAEGEELRFPLLGDLPAPPAPPYYLFAIDDQSFFLWREAIAPPAGWHYVSLRDIRRKLRGERPLFYAAYTAMHLALWYRDNRYCGRCGTATGHSEKERALVCPHCGRVIYPQLIPAVLVAVTDGDRLVLTKYAHRDIPFCALIAGFTEIGETFEECVRREVKEEVGLDVQNIRYYKSQPWGNVQDIMAGFFCDVAGDTTIHRQKDELKEALWVNREDIEGQPDDFSLAHEMMMIFKDGKEPR